MIDDHDFGEQVISRLRVFFAKAEHDKLQCTDIDHDPILSNEFTIHDACTMSSVLNEKST